MGSYTAVMNRPFKQPKSKMRSKLRNFISFFFFKSSLSITDHPLDLPPCILFISRLDVALQITLLFFPHSKLSIFPYCLSISLSLSVLGFCSPSSNNALDPPRLLLLPAYQCNKAWISEIHHYLTQMPVKGLARGSTPVGLFIPIHPVHFHHIHPKWLSIFSTW